MSLRVIRTFFLLLCGVAGYAVSQYRPEIINGGIYGLGIGLSLGSLLIGLDQMLKGFSLRAFSAATFGLILGTIVAWLIDRTQLFIYADEKTRNFYDRFMRGEKPQAGWVNDSDFETQVIK